MVIIRKPTSEEKMLMEWFFEKQIECNGVIKAHITMVENLLETNELPLELVEEIKGDQLCALDHRGFVFRISQEEYERLTNLVGFKEFCERRISVN